EARGMEISLDREQMLADLGADAARVDSGVHGHLQCGFELPRHYRPTRQRVSAHPRSLSPPSARGPDLPRRLLSPSSMAGGRMAPRTRFALSGVAILIPGDLELAHQTASIGR